MALLVKEVRRTLLPLTYAVLIFGLALAAFGLVLVRLGHTGTAEMTLFGQSIKTTSIGIAAIFIGAVAVVRMVRRMFEWVDTAIRRESPEQPEPQWKLRLRRR
jgi:uncharacterized membrane protein YidH (DUF202 family)